MAVFGAALFTYNKMISDSELIVLRAAGLSPFSLAKPAIIVGAVVSVFSFFLSVHLVPLTYREYKELEFKYRQDLPKTPATGRCLHQPDERHHGVIFRMSGTRGNYAM